MKFAEAVKGTAIEARKQGEKTQDMIARLTKDAARKLISGLRGG